MKRTSALLLALTMSAGLAGCSGGEGSDNPTGTAAPTSAGTPDPQGTPLPAAPDLGADPAGIARDVTITECPTEPGDVVAKGTAKNSADAERDLSVMVIWLKNDSGDPLGSGVALLENVAPGATVEWSVPANVVVKADRCVLNARAGTIAEAPAPTGDTEETTTE